MRRFASAVAVAVALAAASAGAAVQATPRPPSGAALSALAQPPTRPPLACQRIYFVMPDRYANGNPANDRGGLSGSRDVTGYDPTDTGYYHGGDLAGLTGDCTGPRGLARIKDLGFTSIWVTPPYRPEVRPGRQRGVPRLLGARASTASTRTSGPKPTFARSSTARTRSG